MVCTPPLSHRESADFLAFFLTWKVTFLHMRFWTLSYYAAFTLFAYIFYHPNNYNSAKTGVLCINNCMIWVSTLRVTKYCLFIIFSKSHHLFLSCGQYFVTRSDSILSHTCFFHQKNVDFINLRQFLCDKFLSADSLSLFSLIWYRSYYISGIVEYRNLHWTVYSDYLIISAFFQ